MDEKSRKIDVPSRLGNILLKYSSSLDLSYEKFLVGVIEQDGVSPVVNVIGSRIAGNIQAMIDKVETEVCVQDVPSDYYEDSAAEEKEVIEFL